MNGKEIWAGRERGGVRAEGKMGQRRDGRGRATHRFVLQVYCGDVEGARPRLFPIHRHHVPVVTGQSPPDSVDMDNMMGSNPGASFLLPTFSKGTASDCTKTTRKILLDIT